MFWWKFLVIVATIIVVEFIILLVSKINPLPKRSYLLYRIIPAVKIALIILVTVGPIVLCFCLGENRMASGIIGGMLGFLVAQVVRERMIAKEKFRAMLYYIVMGKVELYYPDYAKNARFKKDVSNLLKKYYNFAIRMTGNCSRRKMEYWLDTGDLMCLDSELRELAARYTANS